MFDLRSLFAPDDTHCVKGRTIALGAALFSVGLSSQTIRAVAVLKEAPRLIYSHRLVRRRRVHTRYEPLSEPNKKKHSTVLLTVLLLHVRTVLYSSWDAAAQCQHTRVHYTR